MMCIEIEYFYKNLYPLAPSTIRSYENRTTPTDLFQEEPRNRGVGRCYERFGSPPQLVRSRDNYPSVDSALKSKEKETGMAIQGGTLQVRAGVSRERYSGTLR
jgi:hypothetical protein